MTVRRVLGLAATLSLSACRALEAAAPPEPAVLLAPDPAARAELLDAITRELHRASPVLLADDALTRTSLLTIERVMPRDAEGRPFDGRQRGRPERFLLWRVDGRCVLEHEGAARVTLAQAHCAAAPH